MANGADLEATNRPRSPRSGRAHRWAGARSRPPAPSPQLVETLGLALALTDPTARAGPPIAPVEALRRLRAARDEFIGLVSHELRTPVTTIYGNARLLLDHQGVVSSDVRQMLVDIVLDAERLLGIVENLLLLTRSGAGATADREPIALGHHLRRSCESFARRRGRRVICNVGAKRGALVDADPAQLELVVENLLGNADKFSLPDRPIEVSLVTQDGEAIVSVRDRGIGLGESTSDEIFAPFYRGPVARRVTGGMGLGLAVAKRIAEAHGGRVWAKPREDGGAEVGFALPLLSDPGP